MTNMNDKAKPGDTSSCSVFTVTCVGPVMGGGNSFTIKIGKDAWGNVTVRGNIINIHNLYGTKHDQACIVRALIKLFFNGCVSVDIADFI